MNRERAIEVLTSMLNAGNEFKDREQEAEALQFAVKYMTAKATKADPGSIRYHLLGLLGREKYAGDAEDAAVLQNLLDYLEAQH